MDNSIYNTPTNKCKIFFIIFLCTHNRNHINAKISSLSHPSFTTPHARENEAEPESPP
jgi:hypothetical protein